MRSKKGQTALAGIAITILVTSVILYVSPIILGEFTNAAPRTESVTNETTNMTSNTYHQVEAPNSNCDYGLESFDHVWYNSTLELTDSDYNVNLDNCSIEITKADAENFTQKLSYTEYMYKENTRDTMESVENTSYSGMDLLVVGLIILAAIGIIGIVYRLRGR